MMTHERVNTYTKHVWNAIEIGYGRMSNLALGQPYAGQGHHAYEGQPSHDCGQDLKVFGLGNIEEYKGSSHKGEGSQKHTIRVNSRHV